jgi:phenylacetate-CoA ligase
VYPYSPFYRARFDAAGFNRGRIRGRADLARLPLLSFDDIADPGELVLRPDEVSIKRYADSRLVWKVFWAKVTRNQSDFNRTVLEPQYKPLHWHIVDGIPIGYSAEDLGRLGELGRRWLAYAGAHRADVLLGMLPPGPHLEYWELALGCRYAGLSSLFLPPLPSPAQVAATGATMIAGRPADLVAVLELAAGEGRSFDDVHTVLAVGEPLTMDTRDRLRELSSNPSVAVISAWAPPGVRALWTECRTGTTLHTWSDSEWIEIVDPFTGRWTSPGEPGELAWSGIGWKGTVLLRLLTGSQAVLEAGPCPACGRVGVRVVPATVPVRDGADLTPQ